MSSIAVLGEERNILGFKPFGVDVYLFNESGKNPEEWFSEILKENYELIIITESIAEKVSEQIDELWEKELPVVLTIRGLGETTSSSFERLRRLVIKAIGADLFKES
ncbi:MAG: hypothetical protein DRP84_05830 [Spirochaetes bacterium]|nr:MAG: hypothetical protein DRP84_05830 [Spirochaetota bacterium]